MGTSIHFTKAQAVKTSPILMIQKVCKLLETTNLSNKCLYLSSALTCLLDHEQTAYFSYPPQVYLYICK